MRDFPGCIQWCPVGVTDVFLWVGCGNTRLWFRAFHLVRIPQDLTRLFLSVGFGSHPSWSYGKASYKELLAVWCWIRPTLLSLRGLFVGCTSARPSGGVPQPPGCRAAAPWAASGSSCPERCCPVCTEIAGESPETLGECIAWAGGCLSGAREALFPVTATAKLPSEEQVHCGCRALSRQIVSCCWGCCCAPTPLPFLALRQACEP